MDHNLQIFTRVVNIFSDSTIRIVHKSQGGISALMDSKGETAK